MMTVNNLLFENLDDSHYKSAESAVKEYPVFRNAFKDVLGFDEKTDGYVALQKGHQREALLSELHTAAVLKANGHSVILLPEVGNSKHPDALIDGVVSEFKQVRKLTIRALKDDFYESRKKGATRIVLEIINPLERDMLFELLKRLAHNPMVNALQDVFLVIDGKLEKIILENLK
jgi:Contact-dependent growth inhibition CdiA C-terminal domain